MIELLHTVQQAKGLGHLPIVEGALELFIQRLGIGVELGENTTLRQAVFQDNCLPPHRGGRVLVAHLNIEGRHEACLLVLQEHFADDGLIVVRGAAPSAAPAGGLVAFSGLAEDGDLRHVNLHAGLEGIELHEAIAVAVRHGDIRGSLRAGNRVKSVHNRLRHNSKPPLRDNYGHIELTHGVYDIQILNSAEYRLFRVALSNGNGLGVKVLQSADRLEVLVELANVVPQRRAARGVVRYNAEIAGIENDRRIVGNLVADTNSLIRLEDVALRVGGRHKGIDVLKDSHLAVDVVEHEPAGSNALLKLSLREIHVDGQLAVITLVGVGLIHGAAGRRAGHPVHKAERAEAGQAGIVAGNRVADLDNALIIRDLIVAEQIEDHGLELRADLVAHTLCEVDEEVNRGRIAGRAAERIEAVTLDFVEEGLERGRLRRAVRAAGQRSAAGLREGRGGLKGNEVVRFELGRGRYGLRVEQVGPIISAYVVELVVVHVLRDNGLELVADRAGILRLAVGVRGLHAAAVQPVGVKGLRILEKLAEREHCRVGVCVAENLEAVLLKVAVCHGENFAFGPPIQHKRHSRIAALRERRGSFGYAGKIDIGTRQNLILRGPNTAAKSHLISPCLSCRFRLRRQPLQQSI